MTVKGRIVEFKAEGGQGKGYLASPEKPRGAVLVLHAWWGLNDFFKSFANRLASQGFLALAPDLHDGALAKTVAEAKELHSKIKDERVKKIVMGAEDYLRSIPSVSGSKIGVVGFSMGAHGRCY
jgi:carboxymethylenebutenolidase